MFVCACVTALLYQILSLHSKMLMVKSHAELWSNITGLSVSTDSKRSVNYVYDVLLYCCWLCPYHRNLFCCSTKIILYIPSLSQLFTWISNLNIVHPSSYFCPLKCHVVCLTGQVSLLCSVLLGTQLLYSLPDAELYT